MPFLIDMLPALADNYIYLIGDTEAGLAMVVDPGEAEPVKRALQKRNWHLSLILNTHHHGDHTGGNAALKKAYGASVIGPYAERAKIHDLDRAVEEGESISFLGLHGAVIGLSGHTSGHIAYHFPELHALFCGDALFSMGCGRLFEGTAAEMWTSLEKIRHLPKDTRIYCGHEYTESNTRFALMLEKDNPAIQKKLEEVRRLRGQAKPTVPSLLADELRLNPFLRSADKDFQESLVKQGFPLGDMAPAAVFSAIRSARDRFR